MTKKNVIKLLKNSIYYFLIRITVLFFQLCNRPFAITFADKIGRFSYYISETDRKKINKNLKFAYGDEKDTKELEAIAKQNLSYIAMNSIDMFRTPVINQKNIDRIVEVNGLSYFDKAYEKGNGVIVVTGHLGNFELLAGYFGLKGYKVNVISARLYDQRLNDLLVRYRKMYNVNNIPRGMAIKHAIKRLNGGEVLGILPDQDTKVSGVFVPFFGKPAHTAIGPAALALKTTAALMVMTIHLSEDRRHIIDVHPPIELIQTGNYKRDVYENTKKYTEIIEQSIRTYPEQWVWMHRRWKKYKRSVKKGTWQEKKLFIYS